MCIFVIKQRCLVLLYEDNLSLGSTLQETLTVITVINSDNSITNLGCYKNVHIIISPILQREKENLARDLLKSWEIFNTCCYLCSFWNKLFY